MDARSKHFDLVIQSHFLPNGELQPHPRCRSRCSRVTYFASTFLTLNDSFAILCKRRHDNVPVVVKELFGGEMTEEERRTSLNEIQVLSMLKHPNIIAYVGILDPG